MTKDRSLFIIRENVQFVEQKILSVSGNNSIDITKLQDKTITDFKCWDKHFPICFDNFTIKAPLFRLGTYRINEIKETLPRLRMLFSNSELNRYTCSSKSLKGNTNTY